jgi:hypothetical protein
MTTLADFSMSQQLRTLGSGQCSRRGLQLNTLPSLAVAVAVYLLVAVAVLVDTWNRLRLECRWA